jgi:hypothetical protein
MTVSFHAIQNPPPSFVDGFTHAIIRTHIEHVHDCHSPVHEASITNTCGSTDVTWHLNNN